MKDWYLNAENVSYYEAFDAIDVAQLEEQRLDRVRRNGIMKQQQISKFERNLTRKLTGKMTNLIVHPGLLSSIFGPFWRGSGGVEKILPAMSFVRPKSKEFSVKLPATFTALKLYGRETFEPGPEINSISRAIEGLAVGPIVSLHTGVQYDDHEPISKLNFVDFSPLINVANAKNLSLQTQVVARSSRLISTHGGSAYLGILAGIDTIALETGPTRIPSFHTSLALELARRNKVSFSILRVS